MYLYSITLASKPGSRLLPGPGNLDPPKPLPYGLSLQGEASAMVASSRKLHTLYDGHGNG